jgi:CRISPR-associated protein Csm5
MTKSDNLLQYDFHLQTQGPVFIGCGLKLTKTEYCYLPAEGRIYVLDEDRFADYLVQHNLAELYESFMAHASQIYRVDLWRDFLVQNRVTLSALKSFSRYTVRADRALNREISRKSVALFQKDGRSRAYVPGSSIKGALRTALLTHFLLRDSANGPLPLTDRTGILEERYFNTLGAAPQRSDAVNSILRGLSVSDSAPIPTDRLILCQKRDLSIDGRVRLLPLVRECLAPGTEISCSLTIDRHILKDWDASFLLRCLKESGDFYGKTYLSHYRNYTGKFPSGCPVLFLGGGSGYQTKNVVYPAEGLAGRKLAVHITAGVMQRQFRRHHHERDEAIGVSPRMLKTADCGGRQTLFGLCTAELK